MLWRSHSATGLPRGVEAGVTSAGDDGKSANGNITCDGECPLSISLAIDLQRLGVAMVGCHHIWSGTTLRLICA